MTKTIASGLILLGILCVCPITVFADWDKTFGGTERDYGASVLQTADGGYAVAGGRGITWSDSDVWLIKTDSGGNMQWNKTYGGSGRESGNDLVKTADGGFLIVGSTESYGAGSYDLWLIKTDSGGNMQWNRTYGAPGDEYGYDAARTSDGGYILVGVVEPDTYESRDILLIKTDSGGNVQWNRTYGGSQPESGNAVLQAADGGYVIVGSTESYGAGSYDLWLIKTDSGGNMQWDKTYGGPGSDYGYDVQLTSGGDYILVGSTQVGGAAADAWLIKTDSGGNMTWSRTFGGIAWDHGLSVQETSDKGYAFAGETSTADRGSDAWLVKTDEHGTAKWQRTFGGTYSDQGNYLQQTDDGGYIIAGSTESYGAGWSDVWLIQTDAELTKIQLTFPGYSFFAAPRFTWAPDGGSNNAFSVDFSYYPTGPFFCTWDNLHIPLSETGWAMPAHLWDRILPEQEVWWRVRGLDLDHQPRQIVTSDETRSFRKQGTQCERNPQVVSTLDSIRASDVAMSGSYAYVSDSYTGLRIVDVSDPLNPLVVGSVDTLSTAYAVAVAGSYAYVGGQDTLHVIDVSEPTSPYALASASFAGSVQGIDLFGSYAGVAVYDGGLVIVDVADPANPTPVGSVATPGEAKSVTVSGSHAFVADGAAGMTVIDVSDPQNPVLVGSLDTPGSAAAVAISGSHAYIADGVGGLQIADISNVSEPAIVASLAGGGPISANDIAVSDTYAYVLNGCECNQDSLLIVSISDLLNPYLVMPVPMRWYSEAVCVSGSFAYVAGYYSGFHIAEICE